tara:strand:- start:813 stop:1025 length:213 start_codon:yes stop_codon:yes gene_type:complete
VYQYLILELPTKRTEFLGKEFLLSHNSNKLIVRLFPNRSYLNLSGFGVTCPKAELKIDIIKINLIMYESL